MSVQKNCVSEDSNNIKGDHDLGWSTIQTHSEFLWIGGQEESLFSLYSSNWDTHKMKTDDNKDKL